MLKDGNPQSTENAPLKEKEIHDALFAYLQIKKVVGRSEFWKIGNSYLYNETDANYPWFSCLTLLNESEASLPGVIKTAEQRLKKLNRQSAIIIDPTSKPEDAVQIIKGFDYKPPKEDSEDSWLFYPQARPVPVEVILQPQRVDSSQMAKKYIDLVYKPVFGQWGDWDPTNWINSYENGPNPYEHTFIFYQDSQPAAMGGLQRHQEHALLYDIGVLPEFRKQGLGTQVFSFLITQARSLNSPIVLYDTETNGAAEKVGLKFGFDLGFQRQLFVKD